MFDFLSDPQFWVGLGQIIVVNIVLSGDNAVVIALACRSLPAHQQKKAIFWGSAAAIVMRVILTVAAVELLKTPYLKLVGAALLLWIGIKLLIPEHEHEGAHEAHSNLAAAVKTILIADLVMSLDNVIAVAAAARGSLLLLILGLVISIPLIVFGSTMLLKLMDRWPIIITFGAALLGWVAGDMATTDPVVKDWVDANAAWLHLTARIIGAGIVVVAGMWLGRKALEELERPAVDLVLEEEQPRAVGAKAHGSAADSRESATSRRVE